MKHRIAGKIIALSVLLALIFSTVGTAPAEAAGLYTHTWFVEHAIEDLRAYDIAHPNVDYSELLDILERNPATVNYGAIYPDITVANITVPYFNQKIGIDEDWAELIHDTAGVKDHNYSLYLQFLAARYPDDISSKNIDRQTSHYLEFLKDPTFGAQIPSFRAALENVLLPNFKNTSRTDEDEKMIAFLFGLIAHQEADAPWHWGQCNTNWKGLECLIPLKIWPWIRWNELDLDQVLAHYDLTGTPNHENLVYFDYYSSAKPIILAAADEIGQRPVCHLPGCSDALDAGDIALQALWGLANNDSIIAYDEMKGFLETYVPGGIDYGAALAAASWMDTWDILSADINYVKPAASGTHNCDSWQNACTLSYALNRSLSGQEIWVAAGTYTPTTGTDRTATFQLGNGVAVYGSFAGTETARNQRDPAANLTILSGDIDNNDTNTDGNHIAETSGDIVGNNSNHVVTGATGATLDSVTITAGNANGDASNSCGGGMYNDGSFPMLTNVTFSGNTAVICGGGLYNSYSDPILSNVTFSGNTADYGGGMYNYGSNPMLTNATFSGNTADYGGGMYNGGSTPTLINTTFSGNSANLAGGGMYNDGGFEIQILNTILWGNTNGQISAVNGSVPILFNSVVQGGCPAGVSCPVVLITDDPLLGTLGNHGGFTPTILLQAGSPAIDTGDLSVCPAADQRGVARPQGSGCDIGATEMTMIDLDTIPPTITGAATTAPNANGWYNTDVTVHFEAEDAESGLASVTPDQTLTGEGAGQSVTGTAVDLAGNSASFTVEPINIDKTPPNMTGRPSTLPNSYGWYNTDVTALFTAEDRLSGVDTLSPDQTITTEGTEQSAIGYAVDHAGNTGEVTVSMINIDKTAPVVNVSVDKDRYLRTESFIAHYNVSDALSGVISTTAQFNGQPVVDNQSIDLSGLPVGNYTLTVRAEDMAGNVTEVSQTIELYATIESLKETVARLCTEGKITKSGTCNELIAKLNSAIASQDRGNANAAVQTLNAFQSAVQAQAGKSISDSAAELLLADSAYLIDILSR